MKKITQPASLQNMLSTLKVKKIPHGPDANISEHVTPALLAEMEATVTDHFKSIFEVMGFDLTDPNMDGTPARVAKSWVREKFDGRYSPMPRLTEFPNPSKSRDEGNQTQLMVQGPLTLKSVCSHHIENIIGNVWIGVLSDKRVLGLSKFSRLVRWVATRASIQENLTELIADAVYKQLQPRALIVRVRAAHYCMLCRGVHENADAVCTTQALRGEEAFTPELRAEFQSLIYSP